MSNHFKELKKMHRELRSTYEESFSIRIHRSLSWLKRAEKETGDSDARFIFYWISLNSAYSMSDDFLAKTSAKKKFKVFCKKILMYGNEEIYEIIYDRFSEEIRSLMANKFILPAYWHLKIKSMKVDRSSLTIERRNIRNALKDKNQTHQILNAVFTRLFVLRNQIFHGGSTWRGKLNRQQVDDGASLLSHLIPIILTIMMENPNEDWGDIAYPPTVDN
jgi:hypothetical protein